MNIYAYIKISTGEYPLFEGDLRALFKNFTGALEVPPEYVGVYDVDPPEHPEPNLRLVELPPINVNGKFTRNYAFEKRPDIIIPENKKSFVHQYKPTADNPVFPTEATGRIAMSTIGSST